MPLADGEQIKEALQNKETVQARLRTAVNPHLNLISFDNWVFSTVHLWGESSAGTWSLEVYPTYPHPFVTIVF